MFAALFPSVRRAPIVTDESEVPKAMSGAWTVRAPYSVVSPRDEEVDEDDATTSAHASPSKPSFRKKTRPARPTAPYIANFVQPHEPVSDRLFNTRSKLYFLPSDETEFERLERQHTAFTVGFGGLYPCPEVVRAVLSPEDGRDKSILDLGCGTGIWAIEMAKEFPHATVVGVDLIPCPTRDVPSNCSFEIDDVTAGLDHFNQKFDLVHVRCLCFGVGNYRKTMEDISRCLKPGGLSIFIDGDMELLADDKLTVLPMALGYHERRKEEDNGTGHLEGSWLQRFLYELRYVAHLNGNDLSEAEAAVDEGLWRMPMYDPETCGASSMFTPVGPWPATKDIQESQNLKFAGSLMRMDLLNIVRALHPLFLRHGVSQSILDQWTSAVDYELTSQKYRSWVRLRIAWGRRRLEGRSIPAPKCMSMPPTSSNGDAFDDLLDSWPSHQMEIYQSSDEALMAKAARRMTRGEPPVPFVAQLQNGVNISV